MSRWLFAAILLIASAAPAAVFIVPPDAQMLHESEAVVVATVRQMNSEFDLDGNIVTKVELAIDEVIKGDLEGLEPLTLRMMGGIVGGQFHAVSDNVEYWRGNRALIFLDRNSDGSWTTYGLSLGKFDFVTDATKRQLAVRWATQHDVPAWTPEGKRHEERHRDAARFIAFLRSEAATSRVRNPKESDPPSAEAPADYFVENSGEEELPAPAGYTAPAVNYVIGTDAHYPPSAYTQGNWRWSVFDTGGSVTFQVSGTQPGMDSIGAAQRALAAWTNEPGSNINYVYGGTSARDFVADGFNTIVYNHPTAVPAGAIAYAQWRGGATHTYKGESFYAITEGDVVVKQGLSVTQKVFEEAVTHELGHTLGFRHSDQGTPSSTQAVMKGTLSGAYGATLGPWDVEAATHVYTGTTTTTPTQPRATFTFTDDPLAPGTIIRAVHITELRNAINTRRQEAGLGQATWTDPVLTGVVVKAVHITEMRDRLREAMQARGITPTFAETITPRVTPVRASHIQELRNYVKQ